MSRYVKTALGFAAGFSLGMYDRRNNTFLIFAKNHRDLQDKVAKAEEMVVDEFKNVQNKLSNTTISKDNIINDFETSEWGKKAKKMMDTAKQQWSEAKQLGISVEEYAEKAKDKFENSEWGRQAKDEYNDAIKSWQKNKGNSEDKSLVEQAKNKLDDFKEEFEKSDAGKKAKDALDQARKNWASEKLNIEATGHKIWDDRRTADEKGRTTQSNSRNEVGNKVNQLWENAKDTVKDASDNLLISNNNQGRNDDQSSKRNQGRGDDRTKQPAHSRSDRESDPVVLRKHERPDHPPSVFMEQGVATLNNVNQSQSGNKNAKGGNDVNNNKQDDSKSSWEKGKEQISDMVGSKVDNRTNVPHESDRDTKDSNRINQQQNIRPQNYDPDMLEEKQRDDSTMLEKAKGFVGSTMQTISDSKPMKVAKDTMEEKLENLHNPSHKPKYDIEGANVQNYRANEDFEPSGVWEKTKDMVGSTVQTVNESKPMKAFKDFNEEKMDHLMNPQHKPKQESNVDESWTQKAKDLIDDSKDKLGGLVGSHKGSKDQKHDDSDKKNTKHIDNPVNIDHHAWTPGTEKKAQVDAYKSHSKQSGQPASNESDDHSGKSVNHVADKETDNLVPTDDSKDNVVGNLAYNKPDRQQRNSERAELMANNLEKKAPYNTDAHYITVKGKPIPRANSIVDPRTGNNNNVSPTIDSSNFKLDKETDQSSRVQNMNTKSSEKLYAQKDPSKDSSNSNTGNNDEKESDDDKMNRIYGEQKKTKIVK